MSATEITSRGKHEMANAILRDKELSPAARLVGLYICDFVNLQRGYAWPAQATIAADLGMGASTVSRAIGQLDGRYFQVTRRHRRANEYQPLTGQLAGQKDRFTSQNERLDPSKWKAKPVKMNAHPSYDPIYEPSEDRDLNGTEEARAIDTMSTPKRVFVTIDTPQWEAWQDWRRSREGRGWPHPYSRENLQHGWYFPSEWPEANTNATAQRNK
jgi:hypothetical protein